MTVERPSGLMKVELWADVWRLGCAEGHVYEAPERFRLREWVFLRSEATSIAATLNVYDPFFKAVFDMVRDVTGSWHADGNDVAELGNDAFAVAFDPAPDGSGFVRSGLSRCPCDGGVPVKYGPHNPLRWVELVVPVPTHVWWDEASYEERFERVRERVELCLERDDRFRSWWRPGLAEVEARRYLREVVEPLVGEELVLTSRRKFVTRFVYEYNTRAFVELGDRGRELVGVGPIIIDRRTREVSVGLGDVPLEEQVEGPERENYW